MANSGRLPSLSDLLTWRTCCCIRFTLQVRSATTRLLVVSSLSLPLVAMTELLPFVINKWPSQRRWFRSSKFWRCVNRFGKPDNGWLFSSEQKRKRLCRTFTIPTTWIRLVVQLSLAVKAKRPRKKALRCGRNEFFYFHLFQKRACGIE